MAAISALRMDGLIVFLCFVWVMFVILLALWLLQHLKRRGIDDIEAADDNKKHGPMVLHIHHGSGSAVDGSESEEGSDAGYEWSEEGKKTGLRVIREGSAEGSSAGYEGSEEEKKMGVWGIHEGSLEHS